MEAGLVEIWSGKRCRICLTRITPRNRTREHAYPAWLLTRMREWWAALPDDMKAPGGQRPTILKPVCKTCNETLNDRFETPARELLIDMMDGDALSLSPQDQATASAWIAKTAMVLGLAREALMSETIHPDTAWRLRGDLLGMLKTGVAPQDATIRIAYASDGMEQRSIRPLVPPAWPNDATGIVSIIGLPGLVSETLIAGDDATRARFIRATAADDRFLRIWPQDVPHTMKWPPSALQIFDVAQLRDEWGHREEEVNSVFPGLLLPDSDAAPE